VPGVAFRAALGVSAVLLAMHSLTARTPAVGERSSLSPEKVRLRLDPNVATREELMLLPRIGPTIADYVIEYRASLPPGRAFQRLEDLENVHRIGPVTVAQLRPFLVFPTARTPATGAEVKLP
jgi:DNA uptake protein ComE-like DNA-binding protein